MKKLSAILLALFMLLTLPACSEKEFADKKVSFKGASTLDFNVGETKSVTAILPDNGVETTLTVESSDPALLASLSPDNQLTMTSEKAGSYNISLTLSAKGYASCTVDYPIEVSLNPQKVSVKADGKDAAKGVERNFGEGFSLSVKSSANGFKTDIALSDESVIKASSDPLKFESVKPGECDVTVTVTADGYEPYSLTFPVKIKETEVEFSLSAETVTGTIGDTLSLKAEYQQGASIAVSCDNDAVTVKNDGGNITVTSNTAGSYELTVTCSAENYATAQKTFYAVFNIPRINLNIPSSLYLESGKSSTLNITGHPAGTTFVVKTSPRVTSSLNGSTLTLTGNAAGSAEMTIDASCPGYQKVHYYVTITVTSPAYTISQTYANFEREVAKYTNEERTSRGLSKLEYLPELTAGCQIRAKESAKLWSHDRPDGRGWESVIYDMGITGCYAAGENLLMADVLDARVAVDAWMDSPGHRENILKENFDAICVGICKVGGDYYYTQHFIDRY